MATTNFLRTTARLFLRGRKNAARGVPVAPRNRTCGKRAKEERKDVARVGRYYLPHYGTYGNLVRVSQHWDRAA